MAFPLIVANITTPLLGLVDTAILGHMDDAHYLAGASIGSLILTQLYWVCGFLKMSITGLSAQTRAHSDAQRSKVLMQGLGFAVVVGLGFIALQGPILQAGFFFAQSSVAVASSIQAYFEVRVWGAPAALANLALVGWLIGQQRTKTVLLLQVLVNLINILFSVVFVYVLEWGIQGVAAGTLVAEYALLFCSLYCARALVPFHHIRKAWFTWRNMRPLMGLNSHILVRNLALQLTLAFVTFQGARLGESTAATNAILMQFFALIALGLDGVANAVEATVGEAKGAKDIKAINQQVTMGLLWSSIFALVYALVFATFGAQIIALLTDQSELQQSAQGYLLLVTVLPLIAHWCFLFDGVFVGLTLAKAMRNSMLVSTFLVFFPLWWYLQVQGNWGLWLALCAFLASRGIVLGAMYYYELRYHAQRLLA